MKVKIKIITSVFFMCILFMNCTSKKSVYIVKTFQIEQGWGYSIFEKEKLIIRQQYIPSIGSQKHFKSEKDAFTIATLVIEKLKHHRIPSITSEEIKNSISL